MAVPATISKAMVRKEDRLFSVGEVVLMGGLLAFALYRHNNRYIRRSTETGDDGGGGSSTTSGFNPDPLAAEIYEKIEGYNLYTYPEVAEDILSLTDDELTALYVHYNAYYAEEYPTLTVLFDKEWSATWTDDPYQKVVDRLQRIGLYEGGETPCWKCKLVATRLKVLGLP